MMNLMWEYIIVLILLFSTSLGLISKHLNMDKIKYICFTFIYSISIFALTCIFNYFGVFSMLYIYKIDVFEYIPFIYGFVTILTLIFTIIYLVTWRKRLDNEFSMIFSIFGKNLSLFNKNRLIYNFKLVFIALILISLFAISFSILALSQNNILFNGIEFTLISVIMLLLVYLISKILSNAKREYPAVVGEYMFLKTIFLVILSLTFSTVQTLDYSMFGSYLILTPTYKILYILIIIGFIIVAGVLLSDWQLKKLKRK